MGQQKAWPADNVERRSIDSLLPYAANSRTHSKEQIDQIAASMKEWGFTTPILIDEAGMIIAGHGRVMAAKKLGLKEIPAMVATGWTEAQKKAYVIADNQLALNAGWDEELLSVEIERLQEMAFDVNLLGFSAEALTDLLDIEAMESPGAGLSSDGDVWLLGDAKLIVGRDDVKYLIECFEKKTGEKAKKIDGKVGE